MDLIYFTPPPRRGPFGRYGRLFKGGDAPPPPDPIATANAQADANVKAAQTTADINRTNSVTPFGTTTWSQDPNDQNKWTQNLALSSDAQGLLDQFKAANNAALPTVNPNGLPQVSSADLSGVQLPNMQALQQQAASGFTSNAGDITRSQGLAAGAGGVLGQLQQQAAQTYSKPLSYDSLGAMPTADEAARQKIQDALYANSTRTLDPQYQQQQSDLSSSLAAQGINLGTDAYDRAMGNFSRSKNDAYDQARNDATTMSTDQMGKLFGMQMAGRQEGVNELNTLYNSPMDLMSKGTANYGALEGTLNNDYGVQTAQQGAVQGIASGNYGSQLAGATQNANDIIQQHNMTAGDRTNQMNQDLAVHNSSVQDRNNMLNQLMAMATGSQVANGAQVQVAAAPVAQSIYNSYQGQLSAYNAQQQSSNSFTSMLGQLGGSAMMAAAMM